MLRRFFIIIVISVLLVPLATIFGKADSQSIKITELTAGSASSLNEEYIELVNVGTSSVNMTGWTLEFISSGNSIKSLVTFSGSMLPGQIYVVANYNIGFTPDYTFATSQLTYNGHVVLYDSVRQEVDKLGWGTALSYEKKPISALAGGKIAHRYIDCSGALIDTADNFEDFYINQIANIGSLPTQTKTDCTPPEDPKTCDGIVLSEILPNADGSDAGKEFIEIHNPTTEQISLYGCSIKTNASTKIYEFAKTDVLEAKQYLAIYDTTSGLNLLNSAGGFVTLSTVKSDIVVEYPEALPEEISWALLANEWQQTNRPTPNLENLTYLESETTVTTDENKGVGELPACPEGKYRNPETNRCKKIETVDETTCPTGKYLNPETNRCKSIQLASSILSPCKPGQYRNPETNRCKKIESESTLTPCDEGYERNPETNRCRKVSAVKASQTAPVNTESSQPTINYSIIVIFSMLTLGYGLFEYKSEIKSFWLKYAKK